MSPPRSQPRTLTRVDQLVAEGLVPADGADALDAVAARFRIGISQHLAPRLGSPGVARQFVPDARELEIAPEERADPIGDAAHSPVPGIVHRYPDRVLLMPTLTCAVYCRFCFRRDVVGQPAEALGEEALAAALAYVAAHDAIWEVILTGGDPLVLSPRRLGEILSALRAIPHVKVIRVHTRVPLTNPERLTPALLKALRGRTPVVVVVHSNHADELSPEGIAACGALADAGIPLRSQTVLLRGVNDSAEALTALFRGLVEARILPYYLHVLDRARGTSHFRVPMAEAQALMAQLRGRISGLCLPTLVLDVPGGYGKVPVGPAYVEAAEEGYTITDPEGGRHPWAERAPTPGQTPPPPPR